MYVYELHYETIFYNISFIYTIVWASSVYISFIYIIEDEMVRWHH